MGDTTPPYHLSDGATCHSYCQGLKCCYDESSNGCYNEYEHYCDQFYMCGVIYEEGEGQDEPNENNNAAKKKIQEVCSDQYLISNGQDDCLATCNERECCFIPENENKSCFLKNTSWCEEYIPCTKLDKYDNKHDYDPSIGSSNTNKYSNNKNNNNNNDNNNNDDDILAQVKQACYISPIKATTADYSKCANICQSRMCCFQTNEDLSCYNDKTDWCEEFSPCYKLNINDLIGGVSSTSTTSHNNEK